MTNDSPIDETETHLIHEDNERMIAEARAKPAPPCCKFMERYGDMPLERCEFCGKHKDEIQFLVAGPRVFICNECVDLSCRIISSAWKDKADAFEEKRKKDKELSNVEQ